MAADELQTRCHLDEDSKLRKNTEKVGKSLARSGEGDVLVCESAQGKRIVAQSRMVHGFCKAFAVASASCATSISLRFLALAVF
jgi:hypothetical protein